MDVQRNGSTHHHPLGQDARDPSIARFMDSARQLLIDFQDQGGHPRYLEVHPQLYEAIVACKSYEVRRGHTVMILGVPVVPSNSVTVDAPRVV